MFEAKKTKIEEHKKIKKTLKKIDVKEESARKVKAGETRKLHEKEAKNFQIEEKQKIESMQEKTKLKAKKNNILKKKTISKKKPLTTKKK